ncbi:MAG: hypothetical protein ACRCYS_19870 [Beijerinckiaceae bacterium]
MTEGTSIDDLLNPAEPIDEIAPEPIEQEPQGRLRDETGKFASTKGVDPAEPEGDAGTVPPTDKLPKEDFKAVIDERQKRQKLESELEALKTQFQQLTQQPPAPPPSLWEDEQGWQQHMQQQVLAQADQLSRINASEMAARTQHPDFQEAYDLFNQMAAQNPALVQQAMGDPHPWGRAYQIAKSYQAMQEIGAVDVNDMREKLKAEILAEMQQGSGPVAPRSAIPASLSGERSVASRTGPEWSGPTPLSALLR